jgi:hypothetical protein
MQPNGLFQNQARKALPHLSIVRKNRAMAMNMGVPNLDDGSIDRAGLAGSLAHLRELQFTTMFAGVEDQRETCDDRTKPWRHLVESSGAARWRECRRALELARANLANRPTRRALKQVQTIAMNANLLQANYTKPPRGSAGLDEENNRDCPVRRRSPSAAAS